MTSILLSAKSKRTVVLSNKRGSIIVDNGAVTITAVGKNGKEKSVSLPLIDKDTSACARDELLDYTKNIANCIYLTQDVQYADWATHFTHEPLFIDKQKKMTAFILTGSAYYIDNNSHLFTVNKDRAGLKDLELFSLFVGSIAWHVAIDYSVTELGTTDDFALFYLLMCYVVCGKAVNIAHDYCVNTEGGLGVSDFADELLAKEGNAKELREMGVICACADYED